MTSHDGENARHGLEEDVMVRGLFAGIITPSMLANFGVCSCKICSVTLVQWCTVVCMSVVSSTPVCSMNISTVMCSERFYTWKVKNSDLHFYFDKVSTTITLIMFRKHNSSKVWGH